jgi:hypothetical protein
MRTLSKSSGLIYPLAVGKVEGDGTSKRASVEGWGESSGRDDGCLEDTVG